MSNDKILEFPKKEGAIFNSALRAQIMENIKDKTEEPATVVARTEDAICSYIVLNVMTIAKELGTRLGLKLSQWIEVTK